MAIQQKMRTSGTADLELMIEQFRVAEKRALIKRGVKLWTRAEAERARASVQTLEPDKIN